MSIGAFSVSGETRLERFILTLLAEFGKTQFERLDFHAATERFSEECKKLWLEDVDFRFDIVTHTSRVVDEVILDALSYHFIMMTDRRCERYVNNMSPRTMHRLLKNQEDLLLEEAENALQAAKLTVEAFRRGEIKHKYKTFNPEEHGVTASD